MFASGRQLSAWLGLVPRQYSSGGKKRLRGITKQGDPYIRRLLIIRATSVLRFARERAPTAGWTSGLLARRPALVVAVALANKMARIAWALLTRGGAYRTGAVPNGVMANRSNRGTGQSDPRISSGPAVMDAASTGRTHDCTRPLPAQQKSLDPRGPSTHAAEKFPAYCRTDEMKKKRFTEEQIIGILREQEAGAKAADLARKYAVSGRRSTTGRLSSAAWTSPRRSG